MTFDASYIALCRELRLEREIREGDWWVDDLDGEIKCGSSMSEYLRNQPALRMLPQRPDVVWVPSLADWLSMLEEAGYAEVEFCARAIDMERYLYGAHPDNMDRFTGWLESREEAAARLWMAVAGRTVTAT